PTIPTTSPKVVERKTEVTKDTMPPTNNGSTKDVQPPVVPVVHHEPISKPLYECLDAYAKIRLDSKTLIGNKEKLSEMARTSLNKNCSAVILNVYEGEITLRVGREAITFNLDQTSRYTANYNHMTANQIDVIDMGCEEYSQEVLGFSNVIPSGNPTPYYEPIVSTTSPTLTPFGDSDFLLFEEADSFLAIEVDPTYYDPDGDILLLEAILNSDPSPPPPNQGNYFPETRKDLKICKANSSVNEPPKVELKDLPPHLEYAFLEGNDKLPVIIAKDLKNEEKAALIKVLKSHKRAIAWKLSDIKGINPEFCTHKILMEEDYEPTVQHQRRVNPKIHDVIKKEVEKLLDAGLIYPISDSPWGGEYAPIDWVTGWRVCIDYRKLNEATRKDHFTFPYGTKCSERLAGEKPVYCFRWAFRVYFPDPIDGRTQGKRQPLLAIRNFALSSHAFWAMQLHFFGHFQRGLNGQSSNEHDEKTRKCLWMTLSVLLGILSLYMPMPTWTKNVKTILLSKNFDCYHPRQKKEQRIWPPIIFPDLRNPHPDFKLENKEITETFPLETLGSVALRSCCDTYPMVLQILQTTMRGTSLSRECHPL
ncbi:hypothetical protein Tco_0458591, partial [Tanacetum coccineum]